MHPRIHTLLVGVPTDYVDERGPWRSAIGKRPVGGPVYLGSTGHVGDKVADTVHHGVPDQAVCCHPIDHYRFWNEYYNLDDEDGFGPGAIGENWTIIGADEKSVCIGDIYDVGSATVQIGGPRFPCWKQERKVKRPGYLKEVIRTMRTGWYMRVLTPGEVEAGDSLVLVERHAPNATVADANQCIHGDFDLEVADRVLAIAGLNDFWRRIITTRADEERAQPSLF